jgi:hypothetical protein
MQKTLKYSEIIPITTSVPKKLWSERRRGGNFETGYGNHKREI